MPNRKPIKIDLGPAIKGVKQIFHKHEYKKEYKYQKMICTKCDKGIMVKE